METPFDADPILVEVVRHGFVESVHHGRAVLTDPDGRVQWSVGSAFAPMYPRSSAKPLQAVGLLRAGLTLPPELLALACASHSAEEFQLAGVREILSRADLTEAALQTPPDWPLDEVEKERVLRAGGTASPLLMNCSGQHAAMLAVAAARGEDLARYLDPDHPVQLAILQTIDDLTGEQAGLVAPDGCGAPLFAVTLAGLARAFGRLAATRDGAEPDGAEAEVARAIREHPEWVSGTRRAELALHRAVPGLVGKIGAEGVYAVGLPDGRGIAVKISDGSTRAHSVALAGILLSLGFDHPTLSEQASVPVWGGGRRVGEIRGVSALNPS